MNLRASQPVPHVPATRRTEAMLSLCVLAVGSLLLLVGWSGQAAENPTRWAVPGISDQRLETLVGSLAFWAGSAAVIWWLLSMSMAFLAAACELRGRHASSEQLGQWTPAFMRRLALAVLGLTLLGAPGAQAATAALPGIALSADSASLDPGWTADTSRSEALDGKVLATRDAPPIPPHRPDSLDPGWTPSTVAPEPGLMAPEPRRSALDLQAAHREVVVRAGDSLWVLASRELGPRATDLDIARYWPHWYSTNRDVIGPDPDHLLPGTVLKVPARA